jgi:hypothetical protein
LRVTTLHRVYVITLGEFFFTTWRNLGEKGHKLQKVQHGNSDMIGSQGFSEVNNTEAALQLVGVGICHSFGMEMVFVRCTFASDLLHVLPLRNYTFAG